LSWTASTPRLFRTPRSTSIRCHLPPKRISLAWSSASATRFWAICAISGGSPTSYPTTLRAMRSSRACARPVSTAASPWGPRPAGARSRPSVGARRPRRLPAGALAPRARASLCRPRRFQSPRRGHCAPRTARLIGEPLPLPLGRGCSAVSCALPSPKSASPKTPMAAFAWSPVAPGPTEPRTCSSTPSISSGASAPSSPAQGAPHLLPRPPRAPRPGPSGDRAPRFRLLPSFAAARLPRARPTSQRRIPQLRAPHRRATVPRPCARRCPPSAHAHDRAGDASTHPPASSLFREAAPAGWAGPHVPDFRAGRATLPEVRWPDEARRLHLRPPRAPPNLSRSRPPLRAPRLRSRPLSAPGRLRLGPVAPANTRPARSPEACTVCLPRGVV
jgi:hypothetical protein